jgi:membrane protein DedA with SNARE-associated domain
MIRLPNLGELIGHWGYLAIFLLVIVGNIGLPVPEETALALGGYLAWQGQLRLAVVLTIGVVSATAGDSLGYWLGRRYGQRTIERYSAWILGNPGRLKAVWHFVTRYGLLGVFTARFIPGLRVMAGPLAGAVGLRFRPFVVANVLGAIVYVPYAVGIGYAIGYGLNPYMERIQHTVGAGEHVVLIAFIVLVFALLGWQVLRTFGSSTKP